MLAVLGLASSIAVAHLISPRELGRYALVTAITGLLGQLATLQTAGYYIVTKEPSVRLLRTGLTLEVAIGFALWLLLGLAGLATAAVNSDWEFLALLLLSAGTFITASFSSIRCVFFRNLDYRIPTITHVACFAGSVAIKIALTALGFGALGLVIGDLALSVAFGAAMLWFVPEGRGFAFDRNLARKQLSFGIPSQLSGLLAGAVPRVQQLIVGAVLGTRELGFFYLASRLPEQIYQLARSLAGALLPAFSRSDDRQLERGFSFTVKLSAFFVALPLAVFVALAEPFVTSLYGSIWAPAAAPFALLMAAVAVRFVFWHVGNLLKARERVKEITIVLAAQLLVTAALSYPGAHLWGVTGVAVAALIGEVIFIYPKVRLIRSVVPFPTVRVLRSPLLTFVAGSGVAGAAAFLLPGVIALAIAAVAVTLLFGFAAWRSETHLLRLIVDSARRTFRRPSADPS